MTAGEKDPQNPQLTTSTLPSTTTKPSNDISPDLKSTNDDDWHSSTTDIVAAVTVAILSVIIVLAVMIIVRMLRKRQRALRGERMPGNSLPSITTGVFGTGVAAYQRYNMNPPSVPSQTPAITWEPINEQQSITPSSNIGD